jgi:hypothetical protein
MMLGCIASLFDAPVGVITAVDASAGASPEVVVFMTLAALARVAPDIYTPSEKDCSTSRSMTLLRVGYREEL